MAETAQPPAAETDPNVQIQNAVDAFKAFDNPVANRTRDEAGRFASEQEEPEESEELESEAEEAELEEESDEDAELEADDPEEDEAHPLPPSWPEDKAELWKSLSADARAVIAERDAEQLRATNAKFQEIANARKAAEAEARREAATKRDELIAQIETVEQLYQVVEPDPRAFGYGTDYFNQSAYSAALAEYQANAQALAQFKQQRESLQSERDAEASEAFREWKQQVEAEYAPKLLADVPELRDPTKGEPALNAMIQYAIENGIPQDVFAPEAQEEITSAQLHLVWKAMQYDKARSGKAMPKPKPSPTVRPGVSSPRSAQKAVRHQKARDRLAREGSIEAGAAVFKQFL